MIATINNSISNSEKYIFWTLFTILLGLCLSYGLFVKSTINSVVSRENAQKTISDIRTEVSSMEFAYIELDNSITIDMAKERGYVSIDNPKFLSIGGATKTVSLKTVNQ